MDDATLITALTDAFRAEPRVRAACLSGSRGRGDADVHSDIDLILCAAAEDHAGLCADLDGLVATAADLVHGQRIGALPVFTYVARPWSRFDIALTTPRELGQRSADELSVLFDSEGLVPRPGAGSPPRTEPLAPATVTALTEEFLRVLGLLPVVLGRREPALGVAGFGLLHGMVVRAIRLSAHDRAPAGMLRLRELADPAVYRRLASLPPIAATAESITAAHRECARLFLPLARDLHARCGAAWPEAMAEALEAHLRTTVDTSFTGLARWS